jgi:hypothetical protein
MSSELMIAIIGGFVGGVLGVIGTIVSSYYGPRKFEEWKDEQKEKREYGPRKKLLKQMLDDSRFPDGRYLETLSLVTGTHPDECRRFLIEIGARGVRLKNEREGWVLISKKPLDEQ